jgi:general secretion pathway protein G
VKDAQQLKDPWGNDFRYNQPGRENKPYEIVSLGADGKEGGEGENKDLVN